MQLHAADSVHPFKGSAGASRASKRLLRSASALAQVSP
jgi:hypothetical protein